MKMLDNYRRFRRGLNPIDFADNTARMPISQVFHEPNSYYVNGFHLFLASYNTIPNFINQTQIDCKKCFLWFSEHYKLDIKDCYYSKICNNSGQFDYDDIFYFLFDDLIIHIDIERSVVNFYFRITDIRQIEEIIFELRRFKKRKLREKSEISLLVHENQRLEVKSLEISRPRLRIEDNYNQDFLEIHKTIIKRLSKKNDKGLVLLHGKPGTGKTSYVRYLISMVKKSVIFLPVNMANAITNPNLVSILIKNPNSIFVIEDAENLVMDREQVGNSPVSTLLNISDGLLADCLNIQIICTFNTDISKIDNALLRKGRLIAKYEFRELEIQKAQVLSDKLGFQTLITEPMSLTSIYNQDEMHFNQTTTRKRIGFRTDGIISIAQN